MQRAEVDEDGNYSVPVRAEIPVDLDLMARALAAKCGAPPRPNGRGGWANRVGEVRARAEIAAFLRYRVVGSPEPEFQEEAISEKTLDAWRTYLVYGLGAFPPEALPEPAAVNAPNEASLPNREA